MKISLAERGGLAASTRMAAAARVLDVGALPAKDAAALARLIAAARAAAVPAAVQGVRDGMRYMITIDDGGQVTTLAQGDAAMTDEFAALRDWVRDHLPD